MLGLPIVHPSTQVGPRGEVALLHHHWTHTAPGSIYYAVVYLCLIVYRVSLLPYVRII